MSGDLSWRGEKHRERSPGRPPEERRKAEREGGRERTKQKSHQPPPPQKTQAPTLHWQATASKKPSDKRLQKFAPKNLLRTKSSSPTTLLKTGAKTSRTLQKKGGALREKSGQKNGQHFPLPDNEKPSPLTEPRTREGRENAHNKWEGKTGRTLTERGEDSRPKTSQKNGQNFLFRA